MPIQISGVFNGHQVEKFLHEIEPMKKKKDKRKLMQSRCKVCRKLFKTKELMRRHLTSHMRIMIEWKPVQENEKSKKTMVKSQQSVQKIANKKENNEKAQKILKPLAEENFYCDICNKFFKTESTLKNHRLVHSDDRRFSCTFCDKTFKCKKYLNSHLVTHSSERQFTCLTCGSSFKWKHVLNSHMKKSHRN